MKGKKQKDKMSSWVYWVCVARVLQWEGCRGGFCEKLLEASPVSNGANVSWLQGGPTTGQG